MPMCFLRQWCRMRMKMRTRIRMLRKKHCRSIPPARRALPLPVQWKKSVSSEEISFPSKLRDGGFLPGDRNFQIPVPAAELIDHFLFLPDVPQAGVIGEPEHAAHVCRLDAHEFMAAGVFAEDIVENPGVIQIFRDCDGERLVNRGVLFLRRNRAGCTA